MIAHRFIFAVLLLFVALALPVNGSSADSGKKTTVVKDAHYGEVLFYFYQEDYFPAIVRLLAAQKQEHLPNHIDESELLLGGLYLSYGHHREAAAIFERLLADNVDNEIRDRTWFFLAKIWQQRGYVVEAQNALTNIKDELPKGMESERQMMQAQLLLDRGEYDKAIALLQDWHGKNEWASYAKFNLAVALVRSGRVTDGARILGELGTSDPFNDELASLRDKANLALGYAYLQDGQPLAAKPALQRVRLEGPFSSKALLGVGWADAEQENYRRALVPWMQLRSRDLLDPAVQESMLAIPYAMAKLDSISQAADYYLNAIEAFYEETNRIDQTIDKIDSGVLFEEFLSEDKNSSAGWNWRLQSLPEGTEARYLYHLLSTHEFQEGLKNYRDLAYLVNNLDRWQESIDVYRNMLDTRELAYNERLPRVEDSLASADLDEMVNRKLSYDATLNRIEQDNDSLALATPSEFELWGEVTAVEHHPALQANIPEAAEVSDKVRLLKGVLQWNLDKEFKERMWNIRRQLRETGEQLVDAQRARRQVDETMRDEPLVFAGLNDRVNELSPRIDSMRFRVDDAMSDQRAFLRNIAVGELQAQKKRIDTYTVQARFALAAIYDRSATVGSTTE